MGNPRSFSQSSTKQHETNQPLPSLSRAKTSRPDHPINYSLLGIIHSNFSSIAGSKTITYFKIRREPSALSDMSAAKLVNKFRRAARNDSSDQTVAQYSCSMNSAAQKRPALLRPRTSLHEKVTGSLKLAKQKYSPASSTLALQRYVKSKISTLRLCTRLHRGSAGNCARVRLTLL